MKLLTLIHRHQRRAALIEAGFMFSGLIVMLAAPTRDSAIIGLILATIGLLLLMADLLYDQWLRLQRLENPELADLLEARRELKRELAEIEARIEERSP